MSRFFNPVVIMSLLIFPAVSSWSASDSPQALDEARKSALDRIEAGQRLDAVQDLLAALRAIPPGLTSSLGTFGFWPNGQASTTSSSGCKTWIPCPGRVQDDSEHSYDSWQTYEITYDQLVAGLQYTKNLLENTPSYEVETFNCTDAAIGAAAAAGVGLPDAHGTYINYGVSFSGNCPGILGPRLTNHNY